MPIIILGYYSIRTKISIDTFLYNSLRKVYNSIISINKKG